MSFKFAFPVSFSLVGVSAGLLVAGMFPYAVWFILLAIWMGVWTLK